ncbi:MAG TPA: LCP family protein [Candidatus Limnocylindrales bacterium]
MSAKPVQAHYTDIGRSARRSRAMAVPRHVRARSAATAAVLSFVFPGAGQAYARRWRPALLFGLPALLLLLVLLAELGQGASHIVGRLFDPWIAVSVMVGVVVFGAWRAAAVVHAWRSARRSLLSWMLVPVLLALIVGMHSFVFVNAAALMGAGNEIFSSDDSFLDDPLSSPTPAPSGDGTVAVVPTPSPITDPLATVPPGYEDYEEEFFPEPEPQIVYGPPAAYDITAIDEHDDGLLNVLLVGIDWKPGRTHRLTDSMIVVSVNSDSGAVYMFRVPRDIARFDLYDGGNYNGKLNTFAGFANRNPERYPEGGMQSLAYQIGYLLGVPIDYYAAVDIPGFDAVVKAVGGVTINNEKEINDTYTGFHLAAGEQRLTAEQTLMYVRSRKGTSDFARARRQQQVLTALRREMMRPEKLASLPGIVDAIAGVLRTNFPREQIDDLMTLAEQVDDQPTNTWVFKFPEWSHHPPRSETNGRSLMFLRMDLIEELSIELFGEKSLYSR